MVQTGRCKYCSSPTIQLHECASQMFSVIMLIHNSYSYSQKWPRNEAIRCVEPCVQYGPRDMPEALSLCHFPLWSSLPL